MFQKVSLGLAAASAIASLAAPAYAQDPGKIYTYTSQNFNRSTGGFGRDLDLFEITYQTTGTRDTFSMQYSYKPEVAHVPNAFWIVVSDGDNPKGEKLEYAILYGDLTTGRVSAYGYKGKNNPSLDMQGPFIEGFTNAVSFDEVTKTVSVNLDVTNINTFDTINALAPGMIDENLWDGVHRRLVDF